MLALYYPKLRLLLLRRTLPELKENHLLPLQQELHGIATYRDSDKSFTFPNGSRLKLGYCDSESDIFQYQGQEYDVIAMEEATHFTEAQQQFLTTCNRSTRKDFTPRMYYTCNPGNVGHAWVKRLFIDRDYRDGEHPEDYVFIPAKVWDNTVLLEANPEYVRTLEALPPELRRAHLDGDWNVFAGQFFTSWDERKHVIDPFPIPDHWLRFRAIDYGLDRLACLWGASDESGNIYIYNEWCISDTIISDAVKGITERSTGRELCTYGPKDLTARSRETGVPRTETFAMCGLPLTVVSNTRIAGWNNMAEWLKIREDGQPRLRIFRNCRELIHCLPLLQHDEKKPDDVATEPHNITHAPDALRYMLDGRPLATEPLPVEPVSPFAPPTFEEQESSFFTFGHNF
jgi:phage terminase large subunit